MFHDLKNSWGEILQNYSYIIDNNGVHISFPMHLFNRFEQEFNLCFVKIEDDVSFKSWQDQYKEFKNEG